MGSSIASISTFSCIKCHPHLPKLIFSDFNFPVFLTKIFSFTFNVTNFLIELPHLPISRIPFVKAETAYDAAIIDQRGEILSLYHNQRIQQKILFNKVGLASEPYMTMADHLQDTVGIMCTIYFGLVVVYGILKR
jgi:hypothetical protein